MKIDRNFIAKKAGVSTATVSRVFNTPENVAPEKVSAVQKAAKEYNYTPNKMASALRRNGTGMISLVEYADINKAPVSRNFLWCYADSVKGAKYVIDKSMYNFNILNLNAANSDSLLKTKFCDGIITLEIPGVFAEKVKNSGIPYVIAYRENSEKFNTVYIDERAGGRLAGEYFVATGHKGYAHITCRVKTDHAGRERYKGFKDGIGGEPLLIDGGFGIKGGFESAQKIIKEIKSKSIDSVFVINDLTAFGVIQAFSAAGIRIPEDVSLIGYDNMPYIDSLPFKLTTIETPLFKTYNVAAEELLRIIKEGGSIHKNIIPDIIIGNSVLDRKRGKII
ncbi:MAG: hypothetical protein A2231_02175 [Candidatus Firestonebacteria bacterium RIFOXYA2_FULL_40_8]|nr:MAG: hypothetical protein A2231_02175 [Candidatus Firestonebacteria bacterium RIFOXYA2_FULL_40_8]